MAKKTPLTELEKFAIRGMVGENKNVDEIKELLDRSQGSRVIENFINEEELLTKEKSEEDHIMSEWKDVIQQTINNLVKGGVDRLDAEKTVHDTIKHHIDLENSTPEPDTIQSAITKHNKTARDLMKRKTENGQSGVTTMTGAASQKGRPTNTQESRYARGNIFNPEEGKIQD